MEKQKRIILDVLIILVAAVGILLYTIRPKTYSTAMASSVVFLDDNRIGMEEISLNLIGKSETVSGEYKGHYYTYDPDKGTVTFEIDGQGIQGGQYWSLIYTDDGYLFNPPTEKSYIHLTTYIERAEKLDDHWWFYWIDYDESKMSDR